MFKTEISFLTTFKFTWSEKKFLSEFICVSPIPSRLARELKLKFFVKSLKFSIKNAFEILSIGKTLSFSP